MNRLRWAGLAVAVVVAAIGIGVAATDADDDGRCAELMDRLDAAIGGDSGAAQRWEDIVVLHDDVGAHYRILRELADGGCEVPSDP